MRRIDDSAEVTIADTGRGIDPDFLPYLFERFRQADSGSTRSYGGLGLGLSIVHHLVHLHGGTVEASSEGSGKGALFTVRLPIATEERTAIYQSGSATPRDLEGARVIVVEDQIDSRLMIETILERAGGRVRSAAAPSEARRMIRESPPELIISDIAMPGEDGLTFIQGLRDSGDDTPALALTAYGGEGEERTVIGAGFDGFLRKPVDPDTLLQAVSQLLYKRRS